MILIKNCGLKSPDDIAQAASSGAHFAGFVHHEKSPRHVTLTDMTVLVSYAKSLLKTVAVFVNPSDSLLDEVMSEVQPDFIQVHDVLSVDRIDEISTRLKVPVITAVSIRSAGDLTHAQTLEAASVHLLFDAKQPGSGTPFDWSLIKGVRFKKPWFLAGGLTADNVGEALRITDAPMVDVSSGIESAPGIKSPEKIAAFNAAVLHASHA